MLCFEFSDYFKEVIHKQCPNLPLLKTCLRTSEYSFYFHTRGKEYLKPNIIDIEDAGRKYTFINSIKNNVN